MVNIAVIGTGATTRKNVYANLNDYAEANGALRIYVPQDKAEFTDVARFALDWAIDKGHEAIFFLEDTSQVDASAMEDYGDVPVVPVDEADDKIEKVFIAFDEEDGGVSEDLVTSLIRDGMEVYDLTDGLFPLTLDEEQQAAEPAAEEPQVTVESQPKQGKEVHEAQDEAPSPQIDEAQVIMEPQPKKTRTRKPKAEPAAQEPAQEPAAAAEAPKQTVEGVDLDVLVERVVMALSDQVVDEILKGLAARLAKA